MDATKPNTNRRAIVWIVVLLIATFTSFGILFTVFIPGYVLDGMIAIILLATAIALPMRQKRFSLYSVALGISSILFLISGSIDYAYHSVINPLPVVSQIEFSKILRPTQVSMGFSELGFAPLYIMLSFLGLKLVSKKSRSKWLMFAWLVFGIAGIFWIVQGMTSVIAGLSKL